jgi:hypothetical protein
MWKFLVLRVFTKIRNVCTRRVVLGPLCFLTDIVGLFSNLILMWFLVPRGMLFSINLVPKQRMFLGQAIYVLGPLQIGTLRGRGGAVHKKKRGQRL